MSYPCEISTVADTTFTPKIGDIVFTHSKGILFEYVADATGCWVNHVGVIIGHDGTDYLVAESCVPLSKITTLTKFIQRSKNQRYEIKRLYRPLSEQEQQALNVAARERMGVWYHLGFNLNSRRQFCSKFVYEVYREATQVSLGQVETFERLLARTPQAGLKFWRLWFFGFIPWQRETVTPNSLYECPQLATVDKAG